jgi:ABC-type transporter Mla subunit MlaD
MGSFEAIVLVLLGVLIGVAVPALLQLRRTLKSAERFLDETGARLRRTLDSADRAVDRVDRIAVEIEGDLRHARALFDAASDLGRSLQRAQGSLRTMISIGTAIGPAVAAAARALFGASGGDGRDTAAGPDAPASAPRPPEVRDA